MGIYLLALRKPKIQLKNITDEPPLIKEEFIDSYQIWSNWRDTNIYIWPKCLQYFWWKINDYDSAQFYSNKIRNYYPNDIELLRFASWLETFEEDIIFELSN